MSEMFRFHALILREMAEWAEDQSGGELNTKEIRLTADHANIELYDYEEGIVYARQPLLYFAPK